MGIGIEGGHTVELSVVNAQLERAIFLLHWDNEGTP